MNVRTQVIKRPGPALLAFLLGVAIGVMALLSVVELWIRNAVDNGPVWVTLSLGLGAGLYYVAHPYFPDFSPHAHSEPQVWCRSGTALCLHLALLSLVPLRLAWSGCQGTV